MELKRVVVTGLGALTPIGNNVREYWDALANGVSGANEITRFDAEKFRTKFACEIKNFEISLYRIIISSGTPNMKFEVKIKCRGYRRNCFIRNYHCEMVTSVGEYRRIGISQIPANNVAFI